MARELNDFVIFRRWIAVGKFPTVGSAHRSDLSDAAKDAGATQSVDKKEQNCGNLTLTPGDRKENTQGLKRRDQESEEERVNGAVCWTDVGLRTFDEGATEFAELAERPILHISEDSSSHGDTPLRNKRALTLKTSRKEWTKDKV